MTENVVDKLFRIMGHRHKEADGAQAKTANRTPKRQTPRSPKPTFEANQVVFETKISQLIAAQNTISAGNVELLNLQKIEEKLGQNLSDHKEAVETIIQEAIARRLSPMDIFTNYADFRYVIVFTSIDKKKARLKTALIAEEIAQRLLGKTDTEGVISIKTMSVKEDGKATYEDIPSVQEMVSDFEDSDADEGAETLSDGERIAEGIDFVFQPVWNAKRDVISTYACVPVMPAAIGTPVPHDPRKMSKADHDILAFIDIAVAKKAIQEQLALLEHGTSAIISMPVHFETLGSRAHRHTYFELLKDVPEQASDRLIFEIHGLPTGIPDSRLAEIIGPLRSKSRAVLAGFGINSRRFDGYHAAGLHAVGFDLHDVILPERKIVKQMDAFVEAANRQKLKTFVHHIRSLSLNTSAIASGVDYLDGSTLSDATDTITGIEPLTLVDLYSRKL